MRGTADESWMQAAYGQAQHRSFVRFEYKAVEDKEATVAEGRPIFKEVEYIEIRVPGDNQNVVHRPVRPEDKQKYARQYQDWKSTGQQALVGTPLTQWPGISQSQIRELEYFGVKTVEQLANLSDSNLQNIGPIRALRQKALDFIAYAKGNAPIDQLRSEIEERDKKIELMRVQLEELTAAIQEKKTKRKE